MRHIHELIASDVDPMLLGYCGDLGRRADENGHDDAQLGRFSAPRSELSSHGCTTIVVAGGTSFAKEISLSYLLVGGFPKGPPAVMAPISVS
jgi:hypothetical protein